MRVGRGVESEKPSLKAIQLGDGEVGRSREELCVPTYDRCVVSLQNPLPERYLAGTHLRPHRHSADADAARSSYFTEELKLVVRLN
ncbi:hypothetical protein NMY22_g3996 [Coprinellus aureogranulatus]|nr:hypothetical protein NMY22_g3996 [Coprinellus aureogranulatus]